MHNPLRIVVNAHVVPGALEARRDHVELVDRVRRIDADHDMIVRRHQAVITVFDAAEFEVGFVAVDAFLA
ncbi:hypothetical protein D3C87_2115020 [compost metagenome]